MPIRDTDTHICTRKKKGKRNLDPVSINYVSNVSVILDVHNMAVEQASYYSNLFINP